MNSDDLKTLLFTVINGQIADAGLNQAQASELLGVKRPIISKLKGCNYDTFSVSKLIDYAVALGVEVEIKIGKKRVKI